MELKEKNQNDKMNAMLTNINNEEKINIIKNKKDKLIQYKNSINKKDKEHNIENIQEKNKRKLL